MPTGAEDFGIYKPISIPPPPAFPSTVLTYPDFPYPVPQGYKVIFPYLPFESPFDLLDSQSADVNLFISHWANLRSSKAIRASVPPSSQVRFYGSFGFNVTPKIGGIVYWASQGTARITLTFKYQYSPTAYRTFSVRYNENAALLEYLTSGGVYGTLASGLHRQYFSLALQSLMMSFDSVNFIYDTLQLNGDSYAYPNTTPSAASVDTSLKFDFEALLFNAGTQTQDIYLFGIALLKGE